MICFYEGENVGIGISLNVEYDLTKLIDIQMLVRSKYNETVFAYKKSDNSLIQESGNEKIFKAIITNEDTKKKSGDFNIQFTIIDVELGVRKSEIYPVHIKKAIIGEGAYLINSEVITHIFEIKILNNIQIIGNFDVNILGSTNSRAIPITNKITGDVINHNLNCNCVRASFFDIFGNQDFNFLWQKSETNANNEMICLFPTNDEYSGTIFIEKLF